MGLVGPVRPAKLLDGLVSGPGQLQGQVHPPLLVLGTPTMQSICFILALRHTQAMAGTVGMLKKLKVSAGSLRDMSCPSARQKAHSVSNHVPVIITQHGVYLCLNHT